MGCMSNWFLEHTHTHTTALWPLLRDLFGGKEAIFHASPSAYKFISKACTFNHVPLMNCCCQFSSHKSTGRQRMESWFLNPGLWNPRVSPIISRRGLRGSWNSRRKLISIPFNLQNCRPHGTLIKKDISEKASESQEGDWAWKNKQTKNSVQKFITNYSSSFVPIAGGECYCNPRI